MSNQPIDPLADHPSFPFSNLLPLLYIAVSLPANDSDDLDLLHWSLLIGPASECPPPNASTDVRLASRNNTDPCSSGLHYNYTAYTKSALNIRVWKYTPEISYPIRAAFPANGALIARFLIAEVRSLDTLTAHINAWSPEERPRTNHMSAGWVNNVLLELDRVEHEAEKSGKSKCLGRRTMHFNNVEAEARQYLQVLAAPVARMGDWRTARPRLDGMEVPTRVLFDRAGDLAMDCRDLPRG